MQGLPSYLRSAVRALIVTHCARIVQLLRLSRTQVDQYCGTDGHQVAGDEPETERSARVMQTYGLRSSVPEGAEVITLAVNGGAGNNVIVASELPGAGPTGQAEGDVELYSTHGQRVRLDADQHVKIDAPGGGLPPAKVIVNGGASAVVRVGDRVDCGTLSSEAVVVAGMPPKLNIKILYRSNDPQSPYFLVPKTLLDFDVPGGSPNTPPDGNQEDVDVRGRTIEGAARFDA